MDRSRLHHTHPLGWFGRVKARANAEQKRSHPLTQSGSLHDASHHVVGNDGLAALGSRQSLINFIRKYFSASQGPLVGSRAHAQLCSFLNRMEAPMLCLWASTRVSPRPISPDEEHVAPGLERMHQTAECQVVLGMDVSERAYWCELQIEDGSFNVAQRP